MNLYSFKLLHWKDDAKVYIRSFSWKEAYAKFFYLCSMNNWFDDNCEGFIALLERGSEDE